MHLEPDLVLEEAPREESEFGQYGEPEDYEAAEGDEDAVEAPAEPEPVVHTPLDLAADARYNATGKRKSAVARVILKPGEGTYSVNGRHLDEYFPRVRLQRMARQPLEAAGYQTRMDVVARIHGGGVSAQATALRHGIARALVEADPALRGEFLTAELAIALGRAATRICRAEAPQVLIVRDTRESGEMLEAALAAGVAAAGGHALLGGVLPTPGASVLALRFGFDLAAVVSASHNPYADNGIKFFGPDGTKLSDDHEAEIERLVELHDEHAG